MTFILGGSLEKKHGMLVAGVHDGTSEFEFKDLRYVQGKISEMKPGETISAFLNRIYKNSTGCLIRQDFRAL